MNLGHLLECTYGSDANIRKQAEQALTNFENQESFILALLQTLVDASLTSQQQQAAAVYLKNLVEKQWQETFEFEIESSPQVELKGNSFFFHSSDGERVYEVLAVNGVWAGGQVNEANAQNIHQMIVQAGAMLLLNNSILCGSDRAAFRDALCQVFIQVDPKIRSQLRLCLSLIIHADFPNYLPGFIPSLENVLLNSSDPRHLENTCVAARVLLQRYQYAGNKVSKDVLPHFSQIFPGLLRLMNIMLENTDNQRYFIIKTILRTFLATLILKLPVYFMNQEIMLSWMEPVLKILESPIPTTIVPDPSKVHDAYKCRKWAAEIIFRIYTQYGKPANIAQIENLQQFATWWGYTFRVKFLEQILSILNQYAGGSFVYHKTLIKSLVFVNIAIDDGLMFSMMKDHLGLILNDICMKCIILNQEELEMWQEDPIEFSRMTQTGFDVPTPRKAALDVFVRLIKVRTSHVLDHVLEFISTTLKNNSEDQQALLKKEAAMQLFGRMQEILTEESNLKNSTNQILQEIIIPDMKHKTAIIRARAQNVIGIFNMIKYENGLETDIIKILVENMKDENLVVRMEAATSISNLLLANPFLNASRPYIIDILENFLAITDQLGSHHMLDITSTLIDALGAEIMPYAVQLLQKLIQVFADLYSQAYAGTSAVVNGESYGASSSCFASFKVLIYGCRESPETMAAIIPIIAPLVDKVFNKEILDFLEDTLEIFGVIFGFCEIPPEWCYIQYRRIIEAMFDGQGQLLYSMLDPLTSLITTNPQLFVQYDGGKLVEELVALIEYILIDEDNQIALSSTRALLVCLLTNCEGLVDGAYQQIFQMLKTRAEVNNDEHDQTLLAACFGVLCWYNPDMFAELGGVEVLDIISNFISKMSWYDRRVTILAFCKILGTSKNRLHSAYHNVFFNILLTAWKIILFSKDDQIKQDKELEQRQIQQALAQPKQQLIDIADGQDLDPSQVETLEDIEAGFMEFLEMIEEDDVQFKTPLDHKNEIIEFWVVIQQIQTEFSDVYMQWFSNVPEDARQRFHVYLKEAQDKETAL